MFEDQILLKIKREYSKDESFALVLKKLSEALIEKRDPKIFTYK